MRDWLALVRRRISAAQWRLLLPTLGLLLAALALHRGWSSVPAPSLAGWGDTSAPGEVPLVPGLGIGGPFTLVGPDEAPVTLASFQGRLVLLFFGYRFCPDVCPTELSKVAAVLDSLDATQRARVAALFITIDPERDSPALLRDYTALFHPGIIGLGGTAAQVADAARRFRVYVAKVSEGRPPGEYLMDHSALLYLLGGDGALRHLFTASATPEAIAQRLREHLAARDTTEPRS